MEKCCRVENEDGDWDVTSSHHGGKTSDGIVRISIADDDRPGSKATDGDSKATGGGDRDDGDKGEDVAQIKPKPWYLRPFKTPAVPHERVAHGAHGKWFLSRAFFSWAFYLVWTSVFRQLHLKDIEELDPRYRAHVQGPELRAKLQHYAGRRCRQPLLRAVFAVYRARIGLAAAAITVYVWTGAFYYLLLRTVARYLAGCFATRDDAVRGGASFGTGVGLVFALAITFFVISMFRAHSIYIMHVVGGQVRTLLGTIMFEKAFVIAPSARRRLASSENAKASKNADATLVTVLGEATMLERDRQLWTTGAVLSTMATDTDRIEQLFGCLPDSIGFVVSMPSILIISYLLLGWPGLAGAGLMIILTPACMHIMLVLARERGVIDRLTARRVDLVHDMLQGVRFLRIFAWEDVFLKRLAPLRAEEIRRSMRVQFTTVSSWLALIMQARASMLLGVGLYTLHGDIRDAPNVVVYALAIWFFNVLAFNMGLTLPTVANASTALRNVEDFLLADEQPRGETFIRAVRPGNAIELEDARFVWATTAPTKAGEDEEKEVEDVSSAEFQLRPVTLEIGAHELVAVVGAVGSGKSTLASAIMGEMTHVSGRVMTRDATIAYHPQHPWIQNATVRDNIIFGQPYEEARYRQIIKACALDVDIDEEFPAGDLTELGERGITISGGQKARLQLARLLYQDLPTVILDDPLSAVDAHTSQHIFDNVIAGGILEGHCRILITHQLHILSRCDRIVWVVDGAVRAFDTYDNLMAKEPAFATYVGDTLQFAEEQVAAAAAHEDPDATPSECNTPEKGASTTDLVLSKTLSRKRHAREAAQEQGERLMVEEERAVKGIPLALYWTYASFAPRWVLPGLLVCLLASQAANILFGLTFAYWSSNKWNLSNLENAMIVLGALLAHFVTWPVYFVGIINFFIAAGYHMSGKALTAVFYSPLSFFDTTPMGRIINRFTLDINYMDTTLSFYAWNWSLCCTAVASTIVVIIYYVPISAAVFVPWFLFALLNIYLYRSTPLEIKRLEVLRTSHYVSRLSEGISGRQAITSSGRLPDFLASLRGIVDELNSIHFMSFATNAWMKIRQDAQVCVLQFLVGLLVVAKRYDLQPGVSVFLLAACAEIIHYLQQIIESGSIMQRGMNSVQRLNEYVDLPSEGARHDADFTRRNPTWPRHGGITIRQAAMRYRPNLPLALHDLDLDIRPGERVGIVGRTGAGKSSLLSILLRTVELSAGQILIDGVDTRTIGLCDLRRAIAVIPQDPTLFQGTLRFNLDPEGHVKDDAVLIRALQAVSLMEETSLETPPNEKSAPSTTLPPSHSSTPSLTDRSRTRLHLSSPVQSEGKNFSAGDRQLIALARALVRESARIIVIDEATSNVDPRTDRAIQRALMLHLGPGSGSRGEVDVEKDRDVGEGRDETDAVEQNGMEKDGKSRDASFPPHTDHCPRTGGKTVLAIAHRVRTVLNYDRIVVMEKGRVVEVGTPLELWYRGSGEGPEGSEVPERAERVEAEGPKATKDTKDTKDTDETDGTEGLDVSPSPPPRTKTRWRLLCERSRVRVEEIGGGR